MAEDSDRDRPQRRREPDKGRLYREAVYLHRDELDAVVSAAERARVSRSEILRRAVRAYFGIAD